MKLTYTGTIEELKAKLLELGGDWSSPQPQVYTLRLNGGIMNWFESTGTIQFQGKQKPKESLEAKVKHGLDPDEFSEPTAEQEALPKEVTPSIDLRTDASRYLAGSFQESELVFGLVSAVGTKSNKLTDPLKNKLEQFGYVVHPIKLSKLLLNADETITPEYDRIKTLMKRGDTMREGPECNDILALGAAKMISQARTNTTPKKQAFIIDSLKRPEEVSLLRKIYGNGFYLIGIHSDIKRRLKYLTEERGLTQTQADTLTSIDENEGGDFGQRTRDTYHLSDLFVNIGSNDDHVTNSIMRFLELIFGHPHRNPTFDEFAMFMAFSSSLRSGDLSR